MFPSYKRFRTQQTTRSVGLINANKGSQWGIAYGQVVSSISANDIFRGDETLEVSVVDATFADAPSISLGRTVIRLKRNQGFPIPFQFYYDRSQARPGYRNLCVQARIVDRKSQLIYINSTYTPLKNNVKVDIMVI